MWRASSWRRSCRKPRAKGLPSNEHFSVDGTLIAAWASMKSVRPKEDGAPPPPGDGGRNVEVNFKGQTRTNDTLKEHNGRVTGVDYLQGGRR